MRFGTRRDRGPYCHGSILRSRHSPLEWRCRVRYRRGAHFTVLVGEQPFKQVRRARAIPCQRTSDLPVLITSKDLQVLHGRVAVVGDPRAHEQGAVVAQVAQHRGRQGRVHRREISDAPRRALGHLAKRPRRGPAVLCCPPAHQVLRPIAARQLDEHPGSGVGVRGHQVQDDHIARSGQVLEHARLGSRIARGCHRPKARLADAAYAHSGGLTGPTALTASVETIPELRWHRVDPADVTVIPFTPPAADRVPCRHRAIARTRQSCMTGQIPVEAGRQGPGQPLRPVVALHERAREGHRREQAVWDLDTAHILSVGDSA